MDDWDVDDGFDDAEMTRALEESMRQAELAANRTPYNPTRPLQQHHNHQQQQPQVQVQMQRQVPVSVPVQGGKPGYQHLQTHQHPQLQPNNRRQATLFEAFGLRNPNPSNPSNALNPSNPSLNSNIFNQTTTPRAQTLAVAKENATLNSNLDRFLLPRPNNNALLDDPNADLTALVPHNHKMNREHLKAWLYPTNCPVREYQFNVIQASLMQNTLVALPTGLGKTFIAAVVMFNFYRWFPEGKIVFMAPTKPLVAQQIEACYKITGIPQADTDEMTGAAKIEDRRLSWATKRVFFLTPQVLQNDLSRGACPSDKVVLVVVDEAHRASGKHAYCEVVKILTDERAVFRVLALTATPGADVKTVQNVIQNLQISKIEIRTEDSLDIKPYTHERNLEVVVLKPSPEILAAAELFKNVIEPTLKRLVDARAYYDRDPKSASRFGMMQARDKFREANRGNPRMPMIEADFAVCIGLCECYGQLLQLGLRMFLKQIESFAHETLRPDGNSSKTRKTLVQSPAYQTLLTTTQNYFRDPTFVSHPKVSKLISVVVGHFEAHAEAVRTGTKNWETRVMVFSNFRESVEEIKEALSQHEPLVKVMSFVGQSSGKKGGVKGCTQKEQLELISKFQQGGYNVLVATCIGEEGLDIGDVDLIVCFDAQNSPIRMLQRMGRTGRKREGRVVLLLSEGKEEDAHRRSQAQYKSVQKAIIEEQGHKLKMFPTTKENALFPPNIMPTCVKANLEIPVYDIKKKSVGGKVAADTAAKAKPKLHQFDHGSGAFLTDAQQREYERDIMIPLNRSLNQPLPLASSTIWQSILLPKFQISNSVLTRRFVKMMQLTESLAPLEASKVDVHNELMDSCLDYNDKLAIDSKRPTEWKSAIKLDIHGDADEDSVENAEEVEQEQELPVRKRPRSKIHRLSSSKFFDDDEEGEDLVDSSELLMTGFKRDRVISDDDEMDENFEESFFRKHRDLPADRPRSFAKSSSRGSARASARTSPVSHLPVDKEEHRELMNNDEGFAFMDDDFGNDFDEDTGMNAADIAAAHAVAVAETPLPPVRVPKQVLVQETPAPRPIDDADEFVFVPDTPPSKTSKASRSSSVSGIPQSSPPSSFPIFVVPDSPVASLTAHCVFDDDSGYDPSQLCPHPETTGRFRVPDPLWPQDDLCFSKGPRRRPAEFYEWPKSFGDPVSPIAVSKPLVSVAATSTSMDYQKMEAKLLENSEGDDFEFDDAMLTEIENIIIVANQHSPAPPRRPPVSLPALRPPPTAIAAATAASMVPPPLTNYHTGPKASSNSNIPSGMQTMSDYSSPIIPRRAVALVGRNNPPSSNTFSSPIESQMPFAKRPQPIRRVIQEVDIDEEDEEEGEDGDGEEARRRKLRRKRSLDGHRIGDGVGELEDMFDDQEGDEGLEWNDNEEEEEGGSEFMDPSSDIGNPTPLAIKVVRQRLQKKPRRAPKLRGAEPVILPKPAAKVSCVGEVARPPKKKVRISDVQPFVDEEVEVSDDGDGSGDEMEGDELNTDLDGFINDHSFEDVSSSQSLPTTSPAISRYQKSLLSPRGGVSRENKLYDTMLNKYREIERARKQKPRDEWEGFETQPDAGAGAEEYYDDPELADFVVDDDDEIEFMSSPIVKPSKRKQAEKKFKPIASALSKEISAPIAQVHTVPTPIIHRTDSVLAAPLPVLTPISRIVADIPSSDYKSSFEMDGPTPMIRNVANQSKDEKELLYVDPGRANRHVEQIVKASEDDRLCILIDNRETRAGINSILKGKYKCRVEFRQLAAGDYVLSNRVAIERKSRSDLISSTYSKRVYDQLDLLSRMYPDSYLLVELENFATDSVLVSIFLCGCQNDSKNIR
ncbi:UNVERIFIED_CONTAM: hypothetical protein HDU68_004488 [Siphonaria sp. JEL0065]|nr:hypothetical protein HDU68_004488 [Siphonaria sp. JEL0065]